MVGLSHLESEITGENRTPARNHRRADTRGGGRLQVSGFAEGAYVLSVARYRWSRSSCLAFSRRMAMARSTVSRWVRRLRMARRRVKRPSIVVDEMKIRPSRCTESASLRLNA